VDVHVRVCAHAKTAASRKVLCVIARSAVFSLHAPFRYIIIYLYIYTTRPRQHQHPACKLAACSLRVPATRLSLVPSAPILHLAIAIAIAIAITCYLLLITIT
jgi:hypothetical protein